ncbi:MAG: hypothetical protein KBS74_00210 [Clostridiales bacterium]|nr:hypothetical protein [Candidatus Cacconaster stercorequi]
MIEVRILVDSVDYDSVAELLVPMVAENLEAKGGLMGKLVGSKKEFAANTARKVLGKMSQDKKNELVVDLINKKRNLLKSKIGEAMANKGIKAKICSISAKKY